MSKREPMTGWGGRLRSVRERLGLTRREMAEMLGRVASTYGGYEDRDTSPSPRTLQNGMLALEKKGVWGARELFWWLPSGLGEPPAWVYGDLDPKKPPRTPKTIALLAETVARIDEARGVLGEALVAGELRGPRAARAVTILDEALSADPSRGSRWTMTPYRLDRAAAA